MKNYLLFGIMFLILGIVSNQVLVLNDFILGVLYGISIGFFLLGVYKINR